MRAWAVFEKRRARWFAGVTLLVFLALAAGLTLRRPPAAAPPTPKPRRSVAVLGFKNVSGKEQKAWLSTALSEMFTTELGTGDSLRAIPGDNIARMKVELQLPETETFPIEALGRIRRNLGCDLVAFGTYSAQNDSAPGLRLDLRLQDTATGETLASLTDVGQEGQLLDLVSRLGARVRERIGGSRPGPEQSSKLRASLPADPQAARLYIEGLEKLRLFDALTARGLLETAAGIEPSAPIIHSALAGAWFALGYHVKAEEEARKASDLSAQLSLQERLPVEARYREVAREWERAVEIYRTLLRLVPDDLEHGLSLAAAQTSAGDGKGALETVGLLRRLHAPSSDDPRIDLEEARAAMLLGDLKRTRAVARSAGEKGAVRGASLLVAQARLAEVDALRRIGSLEEALSLCDQARELYAAAGDRGGVSRALGHMASTLWYRGDFGEAKKAASEALGISREIGDKGAQARALNTLAGILSDQGGLGEARKLYEETLALTTEIGDKDREAVAINNIGIALWKQGDLSRSRRAFAEAVALAKRIGSKRREAFSIFYAGEVLFDQGELGEARKNYEEALRLGRDAGLASFIGDATHGLGKMLLADGDLVGARQKYEEALAIKKQRGERLYAAQNLLALALVSIEEGRMADAETHAREAVEMFRSENMNHYEGHARAALAHALLLEGKLTEASAAVTRARALCEKSEYTAIRVSVAIVFGRVTAAEGHPVEALRELERALVEATRAGLLGLQFEVRLAFGEVEAKSRNAAAGRARLIALGQEASAKGFRLVARKARRVAGGPDAPADKQPSPASSLHLLPGKATRVAAEATVSIRGGSRK